MRSGASNEIQIGDRGLVDPAVVARADHGNRPDGPGSNPRGEGPRASSFESQIGAEEVSALLHYDPASGVLTWRFRPVELFKSEHDARVWNKRYGGKRAFCSPDKDGYLRGRIYRQRYSAHRVIWLMQTGLWPENQIDHINGDQADNRWINLREVTNSENCRNRKRQSNNTSGICGVVWHKATQTWHAKIDFDGVRKHLGSFAELSAAQDARYIAAAELGFAERHGGEK